MMTPLLSMTWKLMMRFLEQTAWQDKKVPVVIHHQYLAAQFTKKTIKKVFHEHRGSHNAVLRHRLSYP